MEINWIVPEPEEDPKPEVDAWLPKEPPPVKPEFIRVELANVTPLWPQVEPLIAGILEIMGTHDGEDVRRMLMAGMCHLWVQWSGRVDAAVVTEFSVYPKGVWLRIWLAGARKDARMDDDALEAALDPWRKQNGCRGYQVMGRMGWLKRQPRFRFCGAMMRTG